MQKHTKLISSICADDKCMSEGIFLFSRFFLEKNTSCGRHFCQVTFVQKMFYVGQSLDWLMHKAPNCIRCNKWSSDYKINHG